jgi:restriction endonuclease S subunit
MRIGEIANIQSGYQFRGKVEPDTDGNVALLQIKDIEDRRRITPETIDRIDFEKAYDQYLIHPGDVLFLSRGHKQFALAIEEEMPDTIASGYFYILRLVTDHLRPAFLAWYINQAPFQAQLAQLSQGSHMPFVSKNEFQDLPVPIPALELQDTIVALFELAEQEHSILTELAEKRSALIQSLTLAAAAHATRAAMTGGH